MKFHLLFPIYLTGQLSSSFTFTTTTTTTTSNRITHHNHVTRNNILATGRLSMAGGEGGDKEWAKALQDSEGAEPGAFEKEMKMKGLFGNKKGPKDPKLDQNRDILTWMEEEGEVYLKDASSWGTAPHPLAISVATIDEATNESTGRGLLARRNINEGDEMLTLPIKLCMTKNAAREVFGKDVIRPGMNEYLSIALLLIHEEFMMGEKSFYRPYLNVLPKVEEVNPTFTWDDDDLDFLQGSPVMPATRSMQSKLRKEYDVLLGDETGLCSRFPARFPREVFTYERWLWAFTNLFSRAVRLQSLQEGETLAMIPYADLINHSPFSNAYIDARQTGDWLVKTGDEEVILYADRGYKKMEQVYISYGPKSNADFLLLYGFALERNPFNSVDVTVSIRPEDLTASPTDDQEQDTLNNAKLDFLAGVGRENTVDFPCYADRYPVEMLEFLRLMQMTPEDTQGQPLDAFDYSRTISSSNEAAVLSSIIDAVKGQLRKYPNSEEQDAVVIQDKALFRFLSKNQRMAVRHRRNEKRLLKRTIAALEKQMRTRGLLDAENLQRAGGDTGGEVLKGDEKLSVRRTALEQRLEKMGLPMDLR